MEKKRAMTMNQARESGFLSESDYMPPIGEWTGKLLGKCWGKSHNLICFFEDIETGKKHRLSAYKTDGENYGPKGIEIDFSQPGIEGQEYYIETELSLRGKPAWIDAFLLDENNDLP